jgi:hypothetical protein
MSDTMRDLTIDELENVGGGILENFSMHIPLPTCTQVRVLAVPFDGAYFYTNQTTTICYW